MAKFGSGQLSTTMCSEALERVENPSPSMREIYRILSRDGCLLVSIPDGDKASFEGHRSYWNSEDFISLAEQNGFRAMRLEWSSNGFDLLIVLRNIN